MDAPYTYPSDVRLARTCFRLAGGVVLIGVLGFFGEKIVQGHDARVNAGYQRGYAAGVRDGKEQESLQLSRTMQETGVCRLAALGCPNIVFGKDYGKDPGK